MIPVVSATTKVDLLNDQNQSPLTTLPTELIWKILLLLNLDGISAVGLTCKHLNAVSQDNRLWRSLFNRRFPTPIPTGAHTEEGACLKAFKNRYLLTNGVCASRFLGGCGSKIVSLLWVEGNLISGTGSDHAIKYYFSHAIRIWNIKSGKCTLALEGHSQKITSLLWVDGNFISGSADHSIKIWDLKSGQCTQTFKGPGRVESLHFANGNLYSVFDKTHTDTLTIKIWDLKSGECTRTLLVEKYLTYSYLWVNGMLIIGDSGSESSIKICDLNSGQCTKTLEGHTARALLWADGKLYSGSPDKTIKIWDINSGQCIRTLSGHTREVTALLWADESLISGSLDETIKIWDSNSGQCIRTLAGQREQAFTLLWADGNLISGNDSTGFFEEGRIWIWDFNAQNNQIFAEIASLFRREPVEQREFGPTIQDPNNIQIKAAAMERFSAMPKKTKDQIYEELFHILKPAITDLESAKNAFHDLHGQSSTYEQKAQAIENYLYPERKVEKE